MMQNSLKRKKNRRQILEEIVAEHRLLYTGRELGQVDHFQEKSVFCSGHQEIDQFLEGGLPQEGLVEFGMPLGKEGRSLLMPFLQKISQSDQGWILWASSHEHYSIFPPSWYTHQINAEHMVFTETTNPAKDLKQAFLQPFFRLIVLDSPAKLTRDDMVFITKNTRQQNISLWLIRPFFLSNKTGNIWAKLRINSFIQKNSKDLIIRVIRGLSSRELKLSSYLDKSG